MKTEWCKIARRGALIALSVCCIATFVGCNDDDGGGGNTNLAGTTWIQDGLPTSSLTFYSDGASFRILDTADGTDAKGNYTLSGNSFTFSAGYTHQTGDVIGFSGDGTISGNSMTVNVTITMNGTFWDAFQVTFTKR